MPRAGLDVQVPGVVFGYGASAATNNNIGALDIFSVKSYGATGNGVTDDSVAIAAAYTAASGKPIYYPTGTYIDSGTHNVANGQLVFGDGPGLSIIKNTHATLANLVPGAVSLGWQIRDLEFNGNAVGKTAISITGISGGGSYGVVRNCYAHNQTSHGFVVDGAWKIEFDSVRSVLNGGDVFKVQRGTIPVQDPSHLKFQDCYPEQNTGNGFTV